jgi:REP element-mobilizing transposase RayT
MRDLPHSARLRWGRWSEPGAAYHVTKCRVEGLQLSLADAAAARIIIESIRWHQARRLAHLLSFVVMPDHVHWTFVLGEERTLAQVLKGFASVTARRIIGACGLVPPVVWQEEYHDRRLRSDERCWATLEYDHANPVRAGLCVEPEQWPWSTAHPDYRAWIEEDYLGKG